MFSLRNFPISRRLWLMLLIAVFMFAVLGGLALKQNYTDLRTGKEVKTQHLVESTLGIVEYFYGLEQSGQLTREQAQEQAQATLRNIRYGRNDYFWINDLRPFMLMHATAPQLEGKTLADYKDPDGREIFNEFVRIVKRDGAGFYNYRWPMPGATNPVDKVSYVQLFSPWGWVLGTGVYLDDIQAEFRAGAIKGGLLGLALVSVMTVLIIGIIRSITIPLERVVSALKDIAEGEGDLTRQLDTGGRDEVAALSLNFNQFTAKLRTIIAQLLQGAATLQQSAVELGQASQATLSISQQQLLETEQIATSMNEVSYGVQDVAKHAEQAASEVGDATQQAVAGQQSISNTLNQTDQLSNTIAEAVSVIQGLADESTQIGGVLEVINSIAEQTNLLALNAAIEAARAGEQGRGFAVVADEVRLLAQRTQESTGEVQRMIDSLQGNSQAAVNVIRQSDQASQLVVEQVNEADVRLTRISEALNAVNDLNASIASSTLQQSHVAEEINQNTNRVAGLSQDSNAAAEQVSQASQHLQRLAVELNQVLSQFKV